MSKTRQRKQAAWNEGYKDGENGWPIRWSRHPQMGSYRAGHYEGSKKLKKEMDRRSTIVSSN